LATKPKPKPEPDPQPDDGPRPDAPDTERTDTAAFTGTASVELQAGTRAQTDELTATEGQPESPDNEGANDDDATPPVPEPVTGNDPLPGTEPEREPEPDE